MDQAAVTRLQLHCLSAMAVEAGPDHGDRGTYAGEEHTRGKHVDGITIRSAFSESGAFIWIMQMMDAASYRKHTSGCPA